uniref:Uncharacterized protein n=1 Tax=Globodera rostochiensis TaxID=31243 RepID=A0A914H137_GLORO
MNVRPKISLNRFGENQRVTFLLCAPTAMKHLLHNLSNDTLRQFIFGILHNTSSSLSSLSSKYAILTTQNKSWSKENDESDAKFCHCLAQLESFCANNGSRPLDTKMAEFQSITSMDFHSDVGKMLYTIGILLMFSFVIFALMIRSISRSRSSAELETLLDAMRFREELDIQLRQKHRLRKAKRKVTTWLCRGNGAKLWQSSPHILISNNAIPGRKNSLQSIGSYIPEIVISTENNTSTATGGFLRNIERQNSYTPSLSLIYDFSYDSRRGSQILSSFEQEDKEQILLKDGGTQLSDGSLSPSAAGSAGNGDEMGALLAEGRGRHGTN